jgi:fructose-bisphosphate aldolase class 1
MNGLPSMQRKEFVEQMQKVKIETIQNSVDNGITFESVPSFVNVSVPIVVLAGGKEQKEVQDSVKKMSEINPNCRYEIWDKAAHNIPPVFAKRFNGLICAIF